MVASSPSRFVSLLTRQTLALVLAGGQGTRLRELTEWRAKPAVPFGGKFRIIDFPLSNCANSDITTVGVLTQYRPRSLNDHIRIGAPWDLDRRHGGVWLLHPYERQTEMEYYSGTADAIQQNFDFIRHYRPRVNVIERPNAEGRGRGIEITGAITLALLGAACSSDDETCTVEGERIVCSDGSNSRFRVPRRSLPSNNLITNSEDTNSPLVCMVAKTHSF